MILLFGVPFGKHFVGKIRGSIEKGTGKVEDKGFGHDSYFDDPKFIVKFDEFRNMATSDVRNAAIM